MTFAAARLTLLALLVAAPAHATSQPDTAPENIIVTGRGLAAPAGAAAYASVTIGRERLANDASRRLEDVLRDVAGFQQFRRTDSRSANPTSQGATLRSIGGNASSRALVLLDGVPVADPFASFIPWSALAPAGLSAVRVTRGGGAGPFGAGAVAGTIELFSAGPGELPGFAADFAYGNNNATEVSAQAAANLGDGFASIAANWDRGDGYILIPANQAGPVDVPAWYDSKNIALRLVVPAGEATELQVGARGFTDNRLRGIEGTESTSKGADASVRLIGRGRWGYELLGYVQARQFSSGFVSVNASRTVATPSLDQFSTPANGYGAKFELRPPVGATQTLQIGADFRINSGTDNEKFRYQFGRFTRLRDAGGQTRSAGIYVEDSWNATEQLLLTGGARLDSWRISGGHLLESDLQTGAPTLTQIYPDRSGTLPTARAGLVWTPLPPLDLRGAAYIGFRLPTPNELYRPFRVGNDATAANAALDPEKLRGGEIGVDWAPLPTAKLSVTGYWNKLAGAITNVTQGFGPGVFPQVGFVAAGGAYRVRENIDAITVWGVEANANLTLGDWSAQGSLSWADPKVEASGVALALDGLRPANAPVWMASGTLGWTHAGINASATLRYVGEQFDDDLNQRPLPPATTFDAAVTVPLRFGLAATARVENLFNELVVSGISSSGTIDRATPQTFWIGLSWARQ
jgi:vitamin B12 transporter